MRFSYYMCKIKLNTKLQLRVNPINNEIDPSLFIGLTLSETLNVVYFTYAIRKMHVILSLFISY
jgi:hypothetical protein